MEPRIERRPAFTVIGMRYRGKSEHGEIGQLWDRFIPRAGEFERKMPPIGYGIIPLETYDMETGEFDYIAGFEVEGDPEVPEGMLGYRVPEQTYAIFTTKLATVKDAFQYAYETWLPQSGYKRADGPEFELYDENFTGNDSDMYVCIPVHPG